MPCVCTDALLDSSDALLGVPSLSAPRQHQLGERDAEGETQGEAEDERRGGEAEGEAARQARTS